MAVQIDFKPEAKERIARSMGYTGNMGKFNEFLASDPSKQVLMERYKMYAGGMVLKAQQGIDVSNLSPDEYIDKFYAKNPNMQDIRTRNRCKQYTSSNRHCYR